MKTRIEKVKLDQLSETKNNPRQISKKDFAILKKSLTEFPEMQEIREIVVDENYTILGGHQRVKAMLANGQKEATVKVVEGLSEEQKRQFVIKDNISNGEWDMDILANEWDDEPLDEWGLNIPAPDIGEAGSLGRDFIMSPFSVLDTRTKVWQNRKKIWSNLFQSEKGRKEDLAFGGGLGERYGGGVSDTSIFDPVLCELMYRWFGKVGGEVLDPFAGGSVRGIVAGCLGMKYFGNDLSSTQITENRKQAQAVIDIDVLQEENRPTWNCGDSANIANIVKNEWGGRKFDMIMSCPPYADLEVYSDDPADLSNMPYEKFIEIYSNIIKDSVAQLKDNRFAVFVVGDVRDKNGFYRGFVMDTIKAFEDAGMHYYNSAILVNAITTAQVRARRSMRNRKLVKVHQNALVFKKGEPNGEEYEQFDDAEMVSLFNNERELVDNFEDVLVFTNASDVKKLREAFAEIKRVD